MKYIIKEIKDSIKDAITQEQAIAKARELFKAMKQEVEKQLPVAMIYGITKNGKGVYFSSPIVCKTDKELKYESNRLKEENPKSTILVLYQTHLKNDSAKRVHDVELYYRNLHLNLAGKYYPESYDASIGGMGGWSPGYYDDIEAIEDYAYEADDDDVAAELFDILADEKIEMSDEELEKFIDDNFDKLVEKYEKQLKEIFQEEAEEAATDYWQKRYDDYEPDYYDD